MSLPQRPGANSRGESAYRETNPRDSYREPRRHSQHRRSHRQHRTHDVESSNIADSPSSPYSPSHNRPRQAAYLNQQQPPPAFGRVQPAQDQGMRRHGSTAADGISRKKSLIRPERRRAQPEDPDYYYRQHAQRMNVYPSTTGNDPLAQGHEDENDDDEEILEINVKNIRVEESEGDPEKTRTRRRKRKSDSNKLQRKGASAAEDKEKAKQKRLEQEALKPPSPWNIYCAFITFWAPGPILGCFGMPHHAQQRAWREKMGLISIILLIMTFVGYLTFGFTQTVCGTPTMSFTVNTVGSGSMIFHGQVYDLSSMKHPGADGIPANTDPIYDLGIGGMDGSFLFQNVNGACKGIITPTASSTIPHNSDGSLAWYFPCKAFKQDGSSSPNGTFDYYNGYACHTTAPARQAFYSPSYFRSDGNVAFSWQDIQNSSRHLTVYNGDVLDLDLLKWLNSTNLQWPSAFDDLQKNTAAYGADITRAFSSGENQQVAQCLSQIIKVGQIDSETIGCIASQVVLYVSLVFILAIVGAKFFLALFFQWFISRKYAAAKTSMTMNPKKRNQQIEDWTNDIYRPAPKIAESTAPSSGKRSSIMPSTSRFTSPYSAEKENGRPKPTTMASQSSTARLIPGAGLLGGSLEPPRLGSSHTNGSRTSLLMSADGTNNRQSTMLTTHSSSMPSDFIHSNVVAQPPVDYEPFGYPLAHAICLVTAYSEGEEGLRTTLDSVATTEYPNSHKMILVICDGLIKGHGETETTPDIVLKMLKDHATPPEEVEAFSYVAVASGSKRHNMAKVYAGFYDYGDSSVIPKKKQQPVPMMVIVKCGTPDEAKNSKPGNRGKRDGQIILMSFLQKVMFDERMTELEFCMFNNLWQITGISPDFYEVVLMVDADTKVFPDSLTHMISAMVVDPEIMGLCGETKIANKKQSWVSMIQVFEYFISHHQSKSFESVFGGVTCLPGCFCMYRIKAPKGGQNYWVPILANPDIVEHYSENVVDTLHKKNLLLLGEDRYLSTLMLRTFPKRKQVFVPQAVCKTTVPDTFKVLLSQRRRWINSTVHNLMELVLVRDLCGTFCFSMQFVVFFELVGTLVLPAAISFTLYVIILSTIGPAQVIPLVLLAMILGLPAVLIVVTAHSWSYVLWMLIYLCSLPIWNFVLPVYSYWKFDDFSWGDTRKTAGEKTKKAGLEYEGEFDSSKITMKRWGDFEKERRMKVAADSDYTSTTARASAYMGSGALYPPDKRRMSRYD